MPPKKGPSPEEFEDIKASLDFLTGEIAAVRGQQTQLLALLELVNTLRVQSEEKDRRIQDLERRVDDMEQYSRKSDLIITGIKIKPRSYARAVATDAIGGQHSEEETSSVEQQVSSYLLSKGIELDLDHVEACHPLPSRNNERPAVIVRFANRKHKVALLKQGRKLKGTNVYINEHLTKKNGDIARAARQLKRQHKIQHTWVSNCKIFIKLNGPPESAKVLVVRRKEELDEYN